MKHRKMPESNTVSAGATHAVEQSVLDNALSLITREFGLDGEGYAVAAFTDKPDSVTVTVVNPDFEVTVKIKAPIDMGVR